LFINSGAKIDAQDNNGRTALMHAIKKNNIEAIKILVSNRADLHLKDDYGKSAILMADENIRKIMFDTLKKKENSKNMFGQKQVFRE
jgi:ankyrin repeat protein